MQEYRIKLSASDQSLGPEQLWLRETCGCLLPLIFQSSSPSSAFGKRLGVSVPHVRPAKRLLDVWCQVHIKHVCPFSGFKPRGIVYMGKFSSPLLHLAICNNTVHVAHLTTGPCGADLYAFTVNLRSGFVQSGGGLLPG
ncbi:hypothetical protein QQF64_009377 [Cirrhinus molitorella]|uniref:Uncharacterized protein n=1 Tax=Cirrhinus molitorella TaxID=172907 RepID=A0ABR3M101_9TELE